MHFKQEFSNMQIALSTEFSAKAKKGQIVPEQATEVMCKIVGLLVHKLKSYDVMGRINSIACTWKGETYGPDLHIKITFYGKSAKPAFVRRVLKHKCQFLLGTGCPSAEVVVEEIFYSISSNS